MSSDLVQSLSGVTQLLWHEPEASLASGILFGTQGHFPAGLSDALRVTGTLHIVAVSGQNMSILGGFVGKLSHIFGWRISLLIQSLAILGYIFLVGGGASVIRSGAMALIALFAQATGRQADSGRALAATAAGMVLVHPDFLSDTGWQLSVLATAGIIWVEPILSRAIAKLPEIVSGSLAVTLSAQLLTWPVIAANFHQFSLISIPANVLVEWSVPWIMGLSMLSVLVHQLLASIGEVISWLAWVPLAYFIAVIYWLAKVPWASVGLIGFSTGMGIMYYTVIAGVIWRWQLVKTRLS